MHSDAATPLNLWKTGCEVYQSCFQCAHLASLPLMSLARDRVTAELPLSLLLEKRELLCGGCGGADILLTSVALTDDADNLLLYRFPYPVGKLMEAENICLELSSKSVYIPYGRDGRDPGRRSHWVDLKAQPQQLAGLPEIAAADEASDRFGGKRAFSRLLQRVNACPGSGHERMFLGIQLLRRLGFDLWIRGCGLATTWSQLLEGYPPIRRASLSPPA